MYDKPDFYVLNPAVSGINAGRWLGSPLPHPSLAAPHIAGVAALVLSQRLGLTCEQVKQVLMHTTRVDLFSNIAPDNTWGNGKINAQAAVNLARTVMFPQIHNVQVNGPRLEWETDIPTTATIRFHTYRNRLCSVARLVAE